MVAFAKPHLKPHTPDRSAKDSGHRYYSPETGRWLNRDPIGGRGGLNLFSFCANDAVGSADTSGLFIWLTQYTESQERIDTLSSLVTRKWYRVVCDHDVCDECLDDSCQWEYWKDQWTQLRLKEKVLYTRKQHHQKNVTISLGAILLGGQDLGGLVLSEVEDVLGVPLTGEGILESLFGAEDRIKTEWGTPVHTYYNLYLGNTCSPDPDCENEGDIDYVDTEDEQDWEMGPWSVTATMVYL